MCPFLLKTNVRQLLLPFKHIALNKELLFKIRESSVTCIKHFKNVIFNKLSVSRKREILGLSLSSLNQEDDDIQDSEFFFDDKLSTSSQHENLKLMTQDLMQQNYLEVSELLQSDRSEKIINIGEYFEITCFD